MHRPDTSTEIQEIYDQRIRSLSEEERFLRGLSLTHFCRQIGMESLIRENPHMSPHELRAHFFERTYGDSFSRDEKEKIIRSFSSGKI